MINGEEKQNQGSVKPYDKLTYKKLIQQLIADVLEVIDDDDVPTKTIKKKVRALMNALAFNQGSLHFKDEIKKKDLELRTAYFKWEDYYHRESNRSQWGNPFIAQPEIDKHARKYWKDLFLFIQDMLGRYEALMEPKDYIEEWNSDGKF